MAAALVWSVEAEDDFDSIIVFLERQSVFYANRWGEKLLDRLETLKQFPEMGRVIPEKQVRFLREILVDDYRVMYAYLNGTINLIGIRHSASLLGKI
jgi:toxin ParE1/3/4